MSMMLRASCCYHVAFILKTVRCVGRRRSFSLRCCSASARPGLSERTRWGEGAYQVYEYIALHADGHYSAHGQDDGDLGTTNIVLVSGCCSRHQRLVRHGDLVSSIKLA
jgi:hypothetical protein